MLVPTEDSDDDREDSVSYDTKQGKSNEEGFSGGRTIISLKNIHKTYLLGVEGVPALRGVTVDIKAGEFIVILGKSGGGKTSMLNIMGTIDKPTKGELTIAGYRIRESTTDEEFARLRLQKIGFVFQTFNLIGSMSALENVSLPMILAGELPAVQIRERATELLTQVGMGPRTAHLPSELSGGEQQRVTIARALANQPSLLLLDEPTGDLDTHNSNIVLNTLIHLNRVERITCVMVTHDRMLRKYAHRVIHMLDGKILKIETIPDSVRREMEDELRQDLAAESASGPESEKTNQHSTELRGTEFYSNIHCAAIPI